MTFERGRREIDEEIGTADPVEVASIDRSPPPLERREAGGLYRRFGKRWLDVALVLVAAPVWVPLVGLLALLVRLDGGPAFFSQARVGMDGRVFRMWKLRSMVPGADGLLEHYLARHPAIRAEWDEKQKLSEDPRITRLGRFLRMSSLDELPQLWNVLTGEMSLVGPRPMMVDQKPLYPGRAYYALRPGLTGPWQVYARNRSSFSDRASFDEAYDCDLSLALDLKMIAMTAPAVLSARGV